MPSEILGMETDWGAWQLNEVTLITGRRVEKNLNEGKDAFYGLAISLPAPAHAVAGGQAGNQLSAVYRSAKGRVTKRMKIPESGVW